MNITFLGTGCAYPSPTRAASGIILQHLNNGEQWLFDCGEGTQIQVQKIKDVKFKKITKIFITHLHGDHVFGLPGFLSTMNQKETDGIIVDIYGPLGLKKMLRTILGLAHHDLSFKYRVHEINVIEKYLPHGWKPRINPISNDSPLPYEIEDEMVEADFDIQGDAAWKLFYEPICGVTVWAVPLRHTVPCIGFVALSNDKQGRLDVKKALSLGCPNGPLLGKLKNGEDVVLPTGIVIRHKDVLSEPIAGVNIAILGDTNNSDSLISLMNRDDIKVGVKPPKINFLVHEATLENDFEEMCIFKGHSTPKMVASIANRLNIDTLILTHFSQRYYGEDCDSCDDKESIKVLKDQIINQSNFTGKVYLAKDLWSFELK